MRRLIPLTVSLAILAIIYWRVDLENIYTVFKNCHFGLILVSLSMVIPLTLLTAWRFQNLIPEGTRMRFGESNQLILAASTLNMVLPSKIGDIAKAYFIKDRGQLNGSSALSLVVFEKICDMMSLLLWCSFGLILYQKYNWFYWLMCGIVIVGLVSCLGFIGSLRFANLFFRTTKFIPIKRPRIWFEKLQEAWKEIHLYFWNEKVLLFKIITISVFIWFLHLLQIWFFVIALKAWIPFLANLALAPLAILAGLIPITFAGIGARDAALIELYRPFFGEPIAIALGILCTARYLLPAIGGLPFLAKYMSLVNKIRSKPPNVIPIQ